MLKLLQKGVAMLVSAISTFDTVNNINGVAQYNYNRQNDQIGDTSFNSLTPAINKSGDRMSQLYKNINVWKNYCHDRILGKKLDIIA